MPPYREMTAKASSGGIGAATCRLHAANSARVAVNGRDQAKIQAVVDAIHARDGEAVGVAGDCADLAALFLASDSASWLTGVTLDVADGYVMP